MSDEEIDASNEEMTDTLRLLNALHEIVTDSADVESVRTAASALTSTQAGLSYLIAHPLVV